MHTRSNCLRAIDRFSLSVLAVSKMIGGYRRRLVLDGKTPLQIVAGDEIAGQYQIGKRFVVVTNYDYFDGVSTWFHLIGTDGKILDIVSTPNYFGFIQNVDMELPGCLRFGFFGSDDQWTLHVLERSVWSFKFLELAPRLNRFLLGRRHLSLVCRTGNTSAPSVSMR